MNRIDPPHLRSFVLREYGLSEKELFESISKEKRNVILNRIFQEKTGYVLTPRGLEKNKGDYDLFDAYKKFEIISFEQLSFDLKQTRIHSKRKLERLKRMAHVKKKRAFEKDKQKRIDQLDSKEYLTKWQPENKKRQKRIEEIKRKREREQDRKFER